MKPTGNTLPPGCMLGHYKLLEPAAQGGFGVLYRAWDDKLKRPVAVKECFPASICHRDPATGHVRPHSAALQAQYDAAINDVFEEAQTLSGLHHAHVVPVYDVFRAAGSLFYVMPWLEGGSLRDRIETGERVTGEESARWLMSLLSALEYLHSRQIIHRDIKPGNIMFDADDNPMVVDFGSALNRATKVDTTTQGEFSPVYASPEQVSGKGKIGPWTDLYALAATWYELLTGAKPESAQQRMAKDDLAPLPSGSTVLEQSIMQNLALNASERCQSAREWQELLLSGKAPQAVARRQRAWLLKRLPLLVLGAAGIFYAGTRLAAPSAPPCPAPTATLDKKAFYRQVCEHLKLPQQAKKLQQETQLRADFQKEYCRKVDGILEEMSTTLDSNADNMEKKRLLRELNTQYENNQKEALEQLQQTAARGHQAAADMMELIYQPESAYPWKSQEELQLLKQMQPELNQEFSPFKQDFLRAATQAIHQISNYGSDTLEKIRARVSAL